MAKLRNKFIIIEPQFYLLAALLLLLLPLKLVIAWTIAVVVHEFGHYIALKLCKINVFRITIGINGVYMLTEEMTPFKEFICALAGPLGGLCLLIFARKMPCTAICGFVQSMFNLIPLYPLDGGRAVRCLLYKLFGAYRGQVICHYLCNIIILLLIAGSILLAFYFHIGILPLIILAAVLIKFKLANKINK